MTIDFTGKELESLQAYLSKQWIGYEDIDLMNAVRKITQAEPPIIVATLSAEQMDAKIVYVPLGAINWNWVDKDHFIANINGEIVNLRAERMTLAQEQEEGKDKKEEVP